MPNAPKTICPGCRRIIVEVGTRCQKCSSQRRATEKPREKTAARGYGGRWQRLSLAYRTEHPLCEECERHSVVKAAECVDHKTPHEGNEDLLYDWANLQALCWSCHSRKTRREPRGGSAFQERRPE